MCTACTASRQQRSRALCATLPTFVRKHRNEPGRNQIWHKMRGAQHRPWSCKISPRHSANARPPTPNMACNMRGVLRTFGPLNSDNGPETTSHPAKFRPKNEVRMLQDAPQSQVRRVAGGRTGPIPIKSYARKWPFSGRHSLAALAEKANSLCEPWCKLTQVGLPPDRDQSDASTAAFRRNTGGGGWTKSTQPVVLRLP